MKCKLGSHVKTIYMTDGRREKLWRNDKGEYCFYFRFADNGGNNVWASSKAIAVSKVKKDFGYLNPVMDSIHKVTLSEANEIDRQLYLMTC